VPPVSQKGRKVYVGGQLHTRSYTVKDGTEKAATEIVVEELVLLDSMPKYVKASLNLKDESNGAPVQQV
jgi:single-stranded DNA-binding protein